MMIQIEETMIGKMEVTKIITSIAGNEKIHLTN